MNPEIDVTDGYDGLDEVRHHQRRVHAAALRDRHHRTAGDPQRWGISPTGTIMFTITRGPRAKKKPFHATACFGGNVPLVPGHEITAETKRDLHVLKHRANRCGVGKGRSPTQALKAALRSLAAKKL
jgi:hypothetical protein